ncbi:hypothetical protein HMPREF0591_4746 [Mycobacterium parascrofulaceum ATCC BAA-614]|uniref:Uncharacterized protein n=1 Tax=Mycobacterium parascrofulaceum ATCC BAA-614 TaxID=525368 RepID=D5PF02_9MYCO|nr:hypothetical protein HMPREF0591_4746 [Mycobacterium parascrofulaceum ATCC BAA-614]
MSLLARSAIPAQAALASDDPPTAICPTLTFVLLASVLRETLVAESG